MPFLCFKYLINQKNINKTPLMKNKLLTLLMVLGTSFMFSLYALDYASNRGVTFCSETFLDNVTKYSVFKTDSESSYDYLDFWKGNVVDAVTPNYKIIKLGNKYSEELVQKAFSSANLCGSYYETKNHDIIFDDGLIVRLLSRKDLNTKNMKDECFVSDKTDFSNITWSISLNGIIVKGYAATPNKAHSK
jgi:hypothetical protein